MKHGFLLVKAFIIATCTFTIPFKCGANALQSNASERRIVTLTSEVVQASQHEVKFRLHSLEDPAPFNIGQERFQLFVPKEYSAKENWGLFIWIDASDTPRLPQEWEAVLTSRKLLCVSPIKAGNARNIFDRIRMAVHANFELRERFHIDPKRVYVSGFSGGARVASMLGIAWADMFTGTISFMGVNFYTDLPMPGGKTFPPTFIPDDDVLEIAKKRCRYVLVTGEKDFNKIETQTALKQGFEKEGFNWARYLEVPAQGHGLPAVPWLEKALGLLETPGR